MVNYGYLAKTEVDTPANSSLIISRTSTYLATSCLGTSTEITIKNNEYWLDL
jgi:hypothetical protein